MTFSILLETFAVIESTGTKIEGLALTPRISRNKVFYTEEELRRNDGITVPLDFEHYQTKLKTPIGSVTFHYDEVLMQLNYRGVITNPQIAELVKNKKYQVSISGTSESNGKSCGATVCYRTPIGLHLNGLALVETPGIPESTLNIIEMYKGKTFLESSGIIDRSEEFVCDCKKHKKSTESLTDVVQTVIQKQIDDLTSRIVTQYSVYQSLQVALQADPTNETLEDQLDYIWNDITYMVDRLLDLQEDSSSQSESLQKIIIEVKAKKTSTNTSVISANESKTVSDDKTTSKTEPKVDSVKEGVIDNVEIQGKSIKETPVVVKNVTDVTTEVKPVEKTTESKEDLLKRIENFEKNGNEQQKKILELEAALKGNVQESPLAKIAAKGGDNPEEDYRKLAEHVLRSVKENGYASFSVNLDKLFAERTIKAKNYAALHEGVSTTGTMPGIDIDRDLIILPGGTYSQPIRQYMRFKSVPEGEDRARFFTGDIPASADQTAGTTATEETHNATSVEVIPSTINGWYTKLNSDDLENIPIDIMKWITDTAVMREADYEANAVFNTEFNSITPGKWVAGNVTDSSVITSDDTASVNMTGRAISKAKAFLQRKGYQLSQIKCAIHPDDYESLISDSALVRYVQQGNPQISEQGILERYFGVELIVTNKVAYQANSTNHAYRSCMFVANQSFALASKRELTIKIRDVNEDNQLRVTANWRVKAKTLDATSTVRISTTTTNTSQ